ncbi:MAG: PIG-L family deacetylase [Actinomycetota bacterium]|nr:PIG-L family deacetylase [Actinomycetota bacterium]
MATFPPPGEILVVSPHLDDAALSCDVLLARDEPTDVLTVFAGTPDPPRRGFWDATCGFRDSAESMRVRKREEQAALAGDARRLLFLDLLDGQYVEGSRGAVDADPIVQAVANWVEVARAGTVALPAGAGSAPSPWHRITALFGRSGGPEPHADHLFVRDVVLRSVRPQRAVILYEELPYSWGGRADRAASRAATANGYGVTPVEAAVDPARKAARISAYASQIPHLSPPSRRLDDPRVLPPVERYWRLEAAERRG